MSTVLSGAARPLRWLRAKAEWFRDPGDAATAIDGGASDGERPGRSELLLDTGELNRAGQINAAVMNNGNVGGF